MGPKKERPRGSTDPEPKRARGSVGELGVLEPTGKGKTTSKGLSVHVHMLYDMDTRATVGKLKEAICGDDGELTESDIVVRMGSDKANPPLADDVPLASVHCSRKVDVFVQVGK